MRQQLKRYVIIGKRTLRLGDGVYTKVTKASPIRYYNVIDIKGKKIGLSDGFVTFYRRLNDLETF